MTINSKLPIKSMPVSERPYEKCQQLGVKALSDAELLAVIINMEQMRHYTQEHLMLMMFDTKNRLIKDSLIFKGTVNTSVIHPREIFIEALKCEAVSIVLIHNHPSGDPTPSREDIAVTKSIHKAGSYIGIRLLDHLIIGDQKYESLYRFVHED